MVMALPRSLGYVQDIGKSFLHLVYSPIVKNAPSLRVIKKKKKAARAKFLNIVKQAHSQKVHIKKKLMLRYVLC